MLGPDPTVLTVGRVRKALEGVPDEARTNVRAMSRDLVTNEVTFGAGHCLIRGQPLRISDEERARLPRLGDAGDTAHTRSITGVT